MLYRALRAAAEVALRWYYADIVVQGAERVPTRGPVIVTANHPNALVDALVVGTTLRRRVLLTAKAALFEHPLLAILLPTVGVVPLRRAKDEREAWEAFRDAPVGRNAESFRIVIDALRHEGVVLIFPEGVSHDEPALAPLRTGAARMALAAHTAGVHGIRIVPFGTLFEEKERPRSRVLVRIGEPIAVDDWYGRGGDDSFRLTADIDAAMRRVTLNFASADRARRAVALARALAAIIEEPPPLAQPRALATEAEIAHRIEVATDALGDAPPELARRTDTFIGDVEALERRLDARHISLADVRISPHVRHGARFVVREAVITALALPIALLGRAVHWIPLRLARQLALRPMATDPSRDQPAMRTMVLGLALVPIWYVAVAVVVAQRLGALTALLLLAVTFLAAQVDFLLRDRLHRVWRRARTYLAIRRDPAFHADALRDIHGIAAEALALEQALTARSSAAQV